MHHGVQIHGNFISWLKWTSMSKISTTIFWATHLKFFWVLAYISCQFIAGKVWKINWAPSSEFVSSSIPSWQILTAHAQPFRGARDLAFCLKIPLDSLFVWASSEGSGETAQMHRLAWTFTARIGDKYQIRLTRSNLSAWSIFII